MRPAQQGHSATDDGDVFFQELLPLCGQDALLGVRGDEVADTPLVVDDAVCGEFFVAAHHGVGIDAQVCAVFPYRGDARFGRQLS